MLIGKSKLMLTLAVTSMVAFSAHAQPPAPESGAAPQRPVAQETVKSFAAAYGSVQTIQEEYTVRLQEVEDRAKAQSLQQEAQAKMISAVEDAGVSVQQYNELVARMDQDAALRQQVFSMIAE